jgi:hypothetical protein
MAKIVSPVYRIAGRDLAIVESLLGRQAFYRSTGINSRSRGKWFPVDEIRPADGWFNKSAYTEGPGLEEGELFHRIGNAEFAKLSEELTAMTIPRGQQVPAGRTETAEVTLNRILDFFRCRRTPKMFNRPVPE